MSLVKFFLFFIIGNIKCRNTSSARRGWKARWHLDFTTMVNQVLCLAGKMSLAGEVIWLMWFVKRVIHLFKFMRKTIDFISYHLPFEVKKGKYLLCLLKEIAFITLSKPKFEWSKYFHWHIMKHLAVKSSHQLKWIVNVEHSSPSAH